MTRPLTTAAGLLAAVGHDLLVRLGAPLFACTLYCTPWLAMF
jgi:hypothetical protein